MAKWIIGFIALWAVALAFVLFRGGDTNQAELALSPTSDDSRVESTEQETAVSEEMPVVDMQLDALAAIFPGAAEPVRHVEIEREDGTRLTADLAGAGKLPESFPADIPMFPGARSAGVLSVGGEGAAGAFVAEAPLEQVYEFFHNELVSGGWKIIGDTGASQPQNDRLAAEKDGSQLWVTITPAGDGKTSQIFLAIQEG